MVYRKGGRRRRSFRSKRKGFAYKKRNAGRLSCLKGMKPEKKFKDLDTTLSPTTSGATLYLPTLAVGTGQSQRIGRKVMITDILLKGTVRFAATSSSIAAFNRVRVMVVQDMQPNGAVFAVTDVLDTADLLSYRNIPSAGRFKILYDHMFNSNPQCGGGDGTTNWYGDQWFPLRINIKCCIDMEYDADPGIIDDCVHNSVHLLALEERAAPASSMHFDTRVRYIG